MSKSKKIKATPIQTRDEMEVLVGEITGLVAQQQGFVASCNTELTLVKAKYAEMNLPVSEALKGKFALAQAWAKSNPEAFGEARSLSMTHGRVGFSTNPPSVQLLNREWSWDKVLEALLADDTLLHYVRIGHEVNKDAILSEREALGADGLKAFGVKIAQDEDFYIKPLVEKTETLLKETA